MIDLAWGHPLPSALPVPRWRACQEQALTEYSWRALTYGHAAGPGPLIEWLCDHLGRIDARAPSPAEVFVTAGASQALDLVSTVLTRPGDAVLVGSPTYHLALRVLADRDVELIDAPADGVGTDPQATRTLLRRLRASGRRVPMLYLVPTFGNPTGATLPAQRRLELLDVARDAGMAIVEDDVYRELVYDGAAPPSLWSSSAGSGVIRIGSFSKTVGPGLRLGWINAEPRLVRVLANRGFVDSGGGLNHTTALTMAIMGTSGRYAEHLRDILEVYRRQRDALTSALRTSCPEVRFDVPDGGWFLWLRLPDGLTATALLAEAAGHSVSFLPGHRCHMRAPADDHVRLSFSMFEPAMLTEAARRLGRALGCRRT